MDIESVKPDKKGQGDFTSERKRRSQETQVIDMESQEEVKNFVQIDRLERIVNDYWDVYLEFVNSDESEHDRIIEKVVEGVNGDKDQVRGDLMMLEALIKRLEKHNQRYA